MVTKKVLYLCVWFFLFFSFARAFQVESNVLTNTVCPSATIVIEEKIIADRAANFEIVGSGPASSFVTILPISFYLEKNQTKYVYAYITPPSNTLPGKYNLIVTISNGYEIKQLSHEIIVENCNEIVLNIEKPKEICACEEAMYRATIKNNGLYTERYNLSIKGIDFAKLSTNTLTLKPKEEKTILIYFYPSCDVREKAYGFTLKAESLDSKAIAVVNGEIKVNNCYNYEVNLEKDFYSVCDGDKEKINFSIINKGKMPNSYEINLIGPAFANIEKRSVALNVNEKASINIFLNPKFGETGNYDLKIKVLADKGKILAEKDVDVLVRECHNFDFSIKLDKSRDKICNGLNKSYELEIKNKGEKLADYVLKLEAPLWIKLEKNNIALVPNQTTTVMLEASPLYTTKPDVYKIKIEAKDRNSEAKQSIELEIETISKEDCYKPKISIEKREVEVARDRTYVVLITIENQGERNATYLLSISGDANRFTKLNPSVLEIQPGKVDNAYLYIAPSINIPLGKYNLTLHVKVNETGIIRSESVSIEIKEKIEEKVNVSLNITEKATEKRKEGFLNKVINWLKSVFGKKQEPTKIPNVSKIESNITNPTKTEEQQEIEKLLKGLESEKTIYPPNIKEWLAKYKYYIIGLLVLIALIFVALIFFPTKKKK